MSDEIADISKQIVCKIIDTKKRIPTRIKAGMYLHESVPHFGCTSQFLSYFVMYEFLAKIFKSHNVKFISTVALEAPVKGANLYLNEFRTKDDMPIYSSELTKFSPQSPIGVLVQCIFEYFAGKGCSGCAYGSVLEEDDICPFCLNGGTKQKLREFLGIKTFAETGWKNLCEAIGSQYAAIIEDLAIFHKKIYLDEEFIGKCENIIDECEKSDTYGNYIGKHYEDILYLNNSLSLDNDEDEDDE